MVNEIELQGLGLPLMYNSLDENELSNGINTHKY